MARSPVGNERSPPASNGDLSRLTSAIAAGITLAGAVLIAVIAYAGWTSNRTSLDRERTLLANGLNRRIARVLNEQKSVAWWDDAVTKIGADHIDLEFADSEFGVFLTETYGHDEVYIVSGDDVPLYAFTHRARRDPTVFEPRRRYLAELMAEARGKQQRRLRQRPDSFGDDQHTYRKLTGVMKVARWSGHVLSVNGRLAIATAITIVPTLDMGLSEPSPKLLVSIKYIDPAFVTELGRSLLLTDLTLRPEAAGADGVFSEPLDGDDGTRGGFLSWTLARPGQVLLTSILPLVVMGVLSVAVLAIGMLRRLKVSATELAASEQQSRYDARHDALSHLPNRPHFAEMLENVLASRRADESTDAVIVAYLDIDRFKDVNDTLGHHAGDELIKVVADRLRSSLRPEDVISRYGGDEFAILWRSASPGSAALLAERIQSAFRERFMVHDQSLSISASIGMATATALETTVDEVMRQADIALYEAKTQGRNRAVHFTQDMAQRVEERRAIELDLRSAIDGNQLRLNYQPILSCSTGEVAGVEALLRWRHPLRGEIPPGKFISIAEQSGLMPELGTWVLRRAMEDWWQWPHLQVSVNLSPVQFRQVDIHRVLDALLAETKVTASRFVLEITEGVLMESTERTHATLEAIRALGFKTALDDFGTGYSSLSYLCNFSFDKIKIDRSFVAGMSKSQGYAKIVNAVITLGKGLGMDIVAEGVETKLEAVSMAQFGCTELQGYYFSKPVETDQLIAFIRAHVARPVATLGRDEGRVLAAS